MLASEQRVCASRLRLKSEVNQTNWLSGINALFGIWLIISPWALGFSHATNIMVSCIISGIVVLVLGAIRFFAGFSTPERRPAMTS